LRPGRRGRATRVPRGLELVFQPFVLAPQALPLGFRAAQVLPQPRDLLALVVDDLVRTPRGRFVPLRHTAVMPKSRSKYKRKVRASDY
jgi:hypothetical protein